MRPEPLEKVFAEWSLYVVADMWLRPGVGVDSGFGVRYVVDEIPEFGHVLSCNREFD